MEINIGDKKQTREFAKRDQFAAELLYFSDCVLKNKEPEPSGQEGLADIRIIDAIYQSAKSTKPVKLGRISKRQRPTEKQEISRPPVKKPELVQARSAHKD